jgi:flagellar motor switch protein FliM
VILKDLEQAWQPVVALHFQCTRSEMNPQFASIVAPSELATVITFDLALDQLIGQINLCLPYSTLEPIRAKLLAPFQSDQLEIDARWIKRMEQQLRELEVDVLVELGWGTIHGRDLLNLSIGDTILLHQDIADPLLVKVEGVPKFRATAGTFKGTHVVKVIEEIQAPGG